MKKLTLFFVTLLLILIPAKQVLAADVTPQSDSQIQQKLIQLIASQSAQKDPVERRGIIGTVTSVSDIQITVNDLAGNTRLIDVDELTKFTNDDTSAKSFGISDIQKGDSIGILGLYHKLSQRLLARFVDVGTRDREVRGTITSLDTANFEAKIVKADGSSTNLNFDSSTKTFSYTKADGMVKSGFSKLQTGSYTIAFGQKDSKDPTLFDVDRVIVLPEIQIAPPATPTP